MLRFVVTVHDLIPYLAGASVSRALRVQTRLLLPRALDRADSIVTVSNWTSRTIEERFPQYRHKITVIPNGFPCAGVQEPRKREESSFVNIITIARGEAYKRVELIADLAKISPPSWRYTVITDSNGQQRLMESGSWYEVQSQIKILKNLSHSEVQNQIKKSQVMVHPSLYEGFCLPAAEAIANQVPVCHVKGSATEEIVGPFGVGLAPNERPEKWIDGIGLLLSSLGSIEFQQKYLEANSHLSTWKNAADELKKLYNRLLESN